jgi:hypothetical protein
MPEQLALRFADDDVAVVAADVAIATYVFNPHAPKQEAPKPFLHPLRTLTGAPLSVHRPWDHRWHKGLQMTWSHLSGENFWGGPTFDAVEGYRWLDNLGSIVHEDFSATTESGTAVGFTEQLAWRSSAGERWMDETRTHTFHSADAGRGLWVLDFTTRLVNVQHERLELGSPSTHGRPNAGYTGFFWRGPRSFTGGTITAAPGIAGAEVMGSEAEWVAFAGQHDDLDGGATVLAMAGTSDAGVPIRWFVRTEPFAAMSPSASFDQEIVLAPGAALTLRHRHVFIDRICSGDELAALAAEFALAAAS